MVQREREEQDPDLAEAVARQAMQIAESQNEINHSSILELIRAKNPLGLSLPPELNQEMLLAFL